MTALAAGATAGPIAVSADGNLWYSQTDSAGAASIGKVSASGQRTAFALPAAEGEALRDLAPTPSGQVWFTLSPPAGTAGAGQIGRVNPDGTLSRFTPARPSDRPGDAAVGPDGSVWVALDAADGAASGGVASEGPSLAKVADDGSLTRFPVKGAGEIRSLTFGPDDMTGNSDNRM